MILKTKNKQLTVFGKCYLKVTADICVYLYSVRETIKCYDESASDCIQLYI